VPGSDRPSGAPHAETGPAAPDVARWLDRLARHIDSVVSSEEVPLPAYPAVALQLKTLATEKAGIAEIARCVGADSALAADVLRCACSAVYRPASRPTTLLQAVSQLGTKGVLHLALASLLAARGLASGPMASLRRRYWIDGLAGAAVAQRLASLRHLPEEDAFLLGLLHDFGKIVVLQSIEHYWSRQPMRVPLPLDELDRLAEEQHVRVGMVLARRWNLPDLLQEIIEAHHQGEMPSFGPLPELIATSDRIVEHLRLKPVLISDDVAALRGVRGVEERDAVLRLASEIPEFIAAFEPATSPQENGELGIAPRRMRDIPPLRSPFLVKTTLAGLVIEYRAVALDGSGVLVEGQHFVPENRLVRVTLEVPPTPLSIWALCNSVDESSPRVTRFELRPYALDRASQTRWAQLCSGGEHHGSRPEAVARS